MKNYFVMGAAVCVAISMVSCKSSESAYKKAYEKSQQNQPATTQVVQQPVQQQPTTVAPVTTVTTTPVPTNENTRTENLTLVSGAGLKAFSVVVGSFSIKANAENLQKKLNGNGYASIEQPKSGMKLEISYDAKTLDHFVQWKMMGVRDYVMGLECGNTLPEGRAEMRRRGQLKFVKPGESLDYKVTIRLS